MAVLENQRHELFCQAIAKGETTSKAFETAGFRAHRGNASRLRADERIGERIREIQLAGAASAQVSVESLLAELEHARLRADSLNQLSASVKAISEKAKVSGLLVQKVEITNKYAVPDNASPDDILQAFWHSCTMGTPDIELTDDDREVLTLVLELLRHLEDQMIGRQMQRVIEQDRATRQATNKASPAQIEYKRMLGDREGLFNSGLFNEKGRPHG